MDLFDTIYLGLVLTIMGIVGTLIQPKRKKYKLTRQGGKWYKTLQP